jgi:glycosyltransferase involved in cell wall biosynthesis
VVHFTSAHPASDTRILHKECRALAAAGFEVTLFAPGEADSHEEGVCIRAIPKATGRMKRALAGNWSLYRALRSVNADLFHFHDPELLPVGILLRAKGRRVIYDAHEHLANDVRGKPWIPAWMAGLLAPLVGALEHLAAKQMTHTVAATPTIAAGFRPRQVTVIHNYPDLGEIDSPTPSEEQYSARSPSGCYVGGVTDARFAREMMSAAADLAGRWPGFRLVVAGPSRGFDSELHRPGIDYRGVLGRSEVVDLLSEARFGIVLLRPTPNNVDGLPTKFFEYLAAGLPVVVTSSTRFIAAMAKDAACGIAVDGADPAELASAYEWLLDHPGEAYEMGQRGRAAVFASYTWASEAQRLVQLYERLLGLPPTC